MRSESQNQTLPSSAPQTDGLLAPSKSGCDAGMIWHDAPILICMRFPGYDFTSDTSYFWTSFTTDAFSARHEVSRLA